MLFYTKTVIIITSTVMVNIITKVIFLFICNFISDTVLLFIINAVITLLIIIIVLIILLHYNILKSTLISLNKVFINYT